PIKEIEAWVENWRKEYGIEKETIRRVTLNPEDRLSKLFTDFQNYRQSLRDLTDQTIKMERDRFERYMLRYFITTKSQRQPHMWHKHVPGYYDYLTNQNIEVSTIKTLLWDLERFGKYLVFVRHMEYPFAI